MKVDLTKLERAAIAIELHAAARRFPDAAKFFHEIIHKLATEQDSADDGPEVGILMYGALKHAYGSEAPDALSQSPDQQ